MKLRDGMRVRCSIGGKVINDAVLTLEKGKWHLCQDVEEGSFCTNKRGFRYSWTFKVVSDGKYTQGVDWIRPHASTNIEDIYVGCKIINKAQPLPLEVLGICGRAVFVSTSNLDMASGEYLTIEELKGHGFSLVPREVEKEKEEEMIEIDGKKYSASTIKEALREHLK